MMHERENMIHYRVNGIGTDIVRFKYFLYGSGAGYRTIDNVRAVVYGIVSEKEQRTLQKIKPVPS